MRKLTTRARTVGVASAVVVSLLTSCTIHAWAATESPTLTRALAVVLDPVSLERVGSLGPQEIVEAHVVLLGLDLPANEGMRAIQFGLDVDPRLVLLETELHPLANVPVRPAPNEWAVGFASCVEFDALPFAVLSFSMMLAPDVVDATDLRVGIQGLSARGEPPMFVHCRFTDWSEPLTHFGGILLNPAGPRILGFASDREFVVEGRPYELGWVSTGADSVFVDGERRDASGLLEPVATASRVHQIRAHGNVDEIERASVSVEVVRTPRVLSFHATEITDSGQPRTQLVWDVVGTGSVELVGVGSFPPRTTKAVLPNATGVWEIVATNEWGTTRATVHTVDLTTLPPVITRLDAFPPDYLPGDEIRLSYLVLGADTARIDPGIGEVPVGDASVLVRPDGAVTYTLLATNSNGTSTREIALTPRPPYIELFSALPETIDRGDSLTVRWRIDGADRVVIEPSIGEVVPVEGALTIVPDVTTSYRLVASNPWGATERWQFVTVRQPSVIQFGVSPLSIFPDEEVVLTWNTLGATRLEVGPPAREVQGPGGVLHFVPEADSTRYWIRLEAPTDTIVAWTRPVAWKKPEVQLDVPTTNLTGGGTIQFVVRAKGADSLHIEPAIGETDPAGGTYSIVLADTLDIVVTATNRAGITQVTRRLSPVWSAPWVRLTSNRSSVFGGAAVALKAEAGRADSLRIDPGVGWIPPRGGTFEVAVEDTTIYVLTAYGRQSTGTTTSVVTRTASVKVNALLPNAHLTFYGEGPQPLGAQIPLRVYAQGAQSLVLEPGVGDVVSRVEPYWVVLDSATTFVLTATNTLGSRSSSVRVELSPPVVKSFRASESRIVPGETSTLSWFIRGARTARIEASDGTAWDGLDAVDSLQVDPQVPTTYTLLTTNGVDADTASVFVDVEPVVIREFVARPASISFGRTTTLSWRVVGEAEVDLVGYGPQPLAGSRRARSSHSGRAAETSRRSSTSTSRSDRRPAPGSGGAISRM